MLNMTRESFWNYVSEAQNNTKNGSEMLNYLTEKLSKETDETIFSFGIIIDELMLESYNEKLWCASYLINGEDSEEFFDFFRLWLISQGKDVYEEILKNPDNLIKYVKTPEEDGFASDLYENEDFFFVAIDAFRIKNSLEDFEEAFEKYLEVFDEYKEKLNYQDEDYPKLKFSWNKKVPNSMKKECPKLFGRLYIGDSELNA